MSLRDLQPKEKLMDVQKLTMEQDQARDLYRAYQEHRSEMTPSDQAIAAIYKRNACACSALSDGLGDFRCSKCGRYHYEGRTECVEPSRARGDEHG